MSALLAVTAALTLAAVPEPNASPWTLTSALGFHTVTERLRSEIGGEVQSGDRLLSALRLGAGLEWRAFDPGAGVGPLFGHTQLWLGWRASPGDLGFGLSQDLSFRRPLGAGFFAQAGLRAGFYVDGGAAGAFGELSIPLAIGWGPIALGFAPGLSIPLGSKDRTALGSSLSRSVTVGLIPINAVLTVYLGDGDPGRGDTASDG